eukprot:TRINITY_DN12932_c0_g1_i1.p1 TRINITY_DN12932_c0_g1~~TRINITY_DN12932_c0_g1_i1.p1  ORF type:complete len:251 (-),score=64.76 TRINITY_DN12932_c0_g1_i1:103-855(-)
MVKKTTFSVSVKLDSLDDFDVEEFTKGMAKALGVSASEVAVTETFFAMSTTITFATAITKAQLRVTAAAVALANGVPAEHVSLSFSSRRLLGSEARRLGSHEGSKVSAKILIPTSEKAKAARIKASVVSPIALAAVAKALGVPASSIATEKVTISVEAKTIATTTGATALQAPTVAKFLEGLKDAAPGKNFVVTKVGEAVVTEETATQAPTPPPTPPPTVVEEESGAVTAVGGLIQVALTLASLGCMAIF